MVAVGGWSGLGGYRAPSGPEASRGVSEGLVTKERRPQVGWGLMAVPCPVSGGPGPPRPPASPPSDLHCLSHGLSARPGCTPSP